MRKCAQCQMMIADEKITVCPTCGTELDHVHMNPAPAGVKATVTIDSQDSSLRNNAAYQYALLAFGLSLVAFLVSFIHETWILYGVGVLVVISWIPLNASRHVNHHPRVSYSSLILQVITSLLQIGLVALVTWKLLNGSY